MIVAFIWVEKIISAWTLLKPNVDTQKISHTVSWDSIGVIYNSFLQTDQTPLKESYYDIFWLAEVNRKVPILL